MGLDSDSGRLPFNVAVECPEELRLFVSACAEQETAFSKLFDTDVSCHGDVSFASKLHEIADTVIGNGGFPHLVLKITVSWLHSCLGSIAGQKDVACFGAIAGHKDVDLHWQALDFQAMEAGIMAGVDHNIKAFKDIANAYGGHVNASEISELLLDRNDHALFVPMWACLFHDMGVNKSDKAREHLIESLSSSIASQVLDDFIAKYTIPLSPRNLEKELLRKLRRVDS